MYIEDMQEAKLEADIYKISLHILKPSCSFEDMLAVLDGLVMKRKKLPLPKMYKKMY